jgi:hypothetical protein
MHDLFYFLDASIAVDVYFQVTGLGKKRKKMLRNNIRLAGDMHNKMMIVELPA